ncbi:MAG: 8-oxo-dGTP diphosphatase [Candidatus Jorgensenbacteria bacterium]|nr:8-oxo-dGTP diphosphatase [Candidatus Jorgensenbacteria bacterium]
MNEKRIPLTLCIVHQPPRVLLGMKKRGFGAGRWNGFGGILQEGETIMQALMREMEEEVGVIPADPEKVGIIDFRFHNKPGEVLEVHIFRTTRFSGEPTESKEMRPQWFEEGSIPFEDMWPDDKYWIPLFLEKRKFKARFLFDDSDAILEQELMEVEEL